MFPGILKSQPLLKEQAIEWLLDTFAWALAVSGTSTRTPRTLVLPTNRFFPGRAASVHGMAELVFRRVVDYSGMSGRPLRLVAGDACAMAATTPGHLPQQSFPPAGGAALAISGIYDAHVERLIGYDPGLVRNPEALIASFAHSLAAIRAEEAATAPPGGVDNLAHATEVLAGVTGFGVMLANSAKTIQVRSCGSCGGGPAGRPSALSQYDVTYTLAVFCQLEDIAGKEVTPHLNKPLRPFFRRALKDVAAREDDVASLRALS